MQSRTKTIAKWLLLLGSAAFCGVTMVVMAAYLYLAPLLPAAETYRDVRLETPLRIYTADNRLIDEIGNRRNPVAYEDIPQVLTDALIATEDVRFYSHPGVDIQSLARGFYGFLTGNALGGGSTITMQLANNLSFDSDNVYLRKFKEIPFALQIQRELSKEEILTLYLNTIYFGAGADGIGAAAYVYYGKEVRDLTLAEPVDEFGSVDIEDAGRAMRAVGADRDLPAEPGARGNADALQLDRKERDRDLLTARNDGVIFARVVQGRCLARP